MKPPAQFLILAVAVYVGWQAVRPDNFKIENMTVNGGVEFARRETRKAGDMHGKSPWEECDCRRPAKGLPKNFRADNLRRVRIANPRRINARPVDRLLNIYRVFPGVSAEIVLAAFKWGRIYNVEPELLLAVAFVESSFNAKAINGPSRGIMQINCNVWKVDMGRIFEVDYNFQQGARILRQYVDLRHGDLWWGVSMYTNGFKGRRLDYVPKVKNLYKKLRGMR